MQDFQGLKVWHRSHAFALSIRALVRTMPKRGFRRLIDQLVDASESIAWNIVEGSGATSRKEFGRFLGMSVRSTMEAQGQLLMARDAGALDATIAERHIAEVTEIRMMLCGLRAALFRADSRERTAPANESEKRTRKSRPRGKRSIAPTDD